MTGSDWDDFRHEDEDAASAELTSRRPAQSVIGLLIAAAMLLLGGAIAIYLAFVRPSSTSATATPRATITPPSPSQVPLGGRADKIDVPALDQSDDLVRRLVKDLSADSVVAAWLSGSGLIRNLVAVTTNLEEGATPAKLIARLRPTGAFRVIDRGGVQVVDPRSYQRYDAAANAIVALDPQRIARLYATFKPRIEEAYGDLGFTNRSFDRSLQAVIVTLVRTPIPADTPSVKRKGHRYVYVDESFERLSPAQKQFLRMGPRNVRQIDLWLRRLGDALGIPASAFAE